MTVEAPAGFRHISEAEPEVLGGVRVYRNVFARGQDIIELDAAHPGVLDGSRWLECDLDETIWPPEIHDITFVDCSLRRSVWDLRVGENIRMIGSTRIPISMHADGDVQANLEGIRARVDGMVMRGHAPGLALIRVAGEGVTLGTRDELDQLEDAQQGG